MPFGKLATELIFPRAFMGLASTLVGRFLAIR